jgi:hypothetical protein
MTPQDARPAALDIQIAQTGEPPSCLRCGGEGLLSATVPPGWPGSTGSAADGTGEVVLCPRCDADDPAAAPLVLFFAVHGQVTAPTTAEFAALLRGWAGQQRTPVDQVALERDLQAWHRGELDTDEPVPHGRSLSDDDRPDWPDWPDWPDEPAMPPRHQCHDDRPDWPDKSSSD